MIAVLSRAYLKSSDTNILFILIQKIGQIN